MTFKLTIPGEPKGKGRPRFTRQGHTFTPQATANYENLVKVLFVQAYPDTQPIPQGTPCTARLTAYFAIPQSAGKKKSADMESGGIRPTKKPDTDNIAKIVLDALNGLAYHDDSQVVDLTVIKTYSRDPRVEVEICDPNR